MTLSRYHCFVTGTAPERARRLHASTTNRLRAWAIALHVPVLLWALTGWVLAARVFGLGEFAAAAAASLCALLIYLIERIVLAMPATLRVAVVRGFIGLLVALLGATSVDLVLFAPEIDAQLREAASRSVQAAFDRDEAPAVAKIDALQRQVDELRRRTQCELDGSCGTGKAQAGPVYRELMRQLGVLEAQLARAEDALAQVRATRDERLRARLELEARRPTGLLERVQALHAFLSERPAAWGVSALFFALMVLFELTVVLFKFALAETIDDRLERMREHLRESEARDFVTRATTPLGQAEALLAFPPR